MTMAPHGSAKSSTGGTKPGEHEPVDFLATGFKVKTNCAFSVKILENFKLRSDHLASGSAPAPTHLARPPPLRILLSWCPRPQTVHAAFVCACVGPRRRGANVLARDVVPALVTAKSLGCGAAVR